MHGTYLEFIYFLLLALSWYYPLWRLLISEGRAVKEEDQHRFTAVHTESAKGLL